jgi:hypothetical protein
MTQAEVLDLFPFTFTIKVTIYITHTGIPFMIPLKGKLFVPLNKKNLKWSCVNIKQIITAVVTKTIAGI